MFPYGKESKVNLGNKKKEITKMEFMKKQKEEKLQRELNRKKESSSILIQAFARRIISNKQLQNEYLPVFDKRLNDLVKIRTMIDEKKYSLAIIKSIEGYNFSKILMSIISIKLGIETPERIKNLIILYTHLLRYPPIYRTGMKDPVFTSSTLFLTHICKLLRFIVPILYYNPKTQDSDRLKVIYNFILTIQGSDILLIEKNRIGLFSEMLRYTETTKLIKDRQTIFSNEGVQVSLNPILMSIGFLSFIKYQRNKDAIALCGCLMNLSYKEYQSILRQAESVSKIDKNELRVNFIMIANHVILLYGGEYIKGGREMNILGNLLYTMDGCKIPYKDISETLTGISNLAEIIWEQLNELVPNLTLTLENSEDSPRSTMIKEKKSIFEVFSSSIWNIFPNIICNITEASNVREILQEINIIPTLDKKLNALNIVGAFYVNLFRINKLYSELLKQYSEFADSHEEFKQSIVFGSISKGELRGEETNMMDTPEESKEIIINPPQAIYKKYSVHYHMLNNLGFKTDLIPFIYNLTQHLMNTQETGILMKVRDLSSLFDLFSLLLAHTLKIVDDVQFKGEIINKPNYLLTLDQIQRVTLFLNMLVYELFNEEQRLIHSALHLKLKTKSKLENDLAHLRENSTQLVRSVFDRDSRLHLFPDDAWMLSKDHFSEAYILTKRKELEVLLNNIPHIFPFPFRVKLLRKVIEDQKNNMVYNPNVLQHLKIRRQFILEDAFAYLHPQPTSLKYDMQIEFYDQQGDLEPGIGQGISKEFLTLLSKEAFNLGYGYFIETEEHTLFPNPESKDLKMFEFLGLIIGKAIYENILIQPIFSSSFLNKMLGKYNHLDDLKSLDFELYTNLIKLKHYKGDVTDFGLYFVINTIYLGKEIEIPLIAKGDEIAVTNENINEYIIRMSDFKLNSRIKKQSEAFKNGIEVIIPHELISIFNHNELQLLIGGEQGKFDLKDLKYNTNYNNYDDENETIIVFWEVLNTFSHEELCNFLMFVTGCSRPPLLGFEYLRPKLCISHQLDESQLPTSSTCMNVLHLPPYKNFDQLNEKLTIAIQHSTGFGFAQQHLLQFDFHIDKLKL